MKKAICMLSIVPALVMLVGMGTFQAVDAEEYIPKVRTKKLYQAPLHGAEGKEMTVVHFAAPPGYVGAKHFHSGPVFVYVLEGELTVELEGKTKTIRAGELYPEEIDASMIARNLSTTDDLEILVFQVGDIGKPMMIKVE